MGQKPVLIRVRKQYGRLDSGPCTLDAQPMAGLRTFYAGEHPAAGSEIALDPQEGKHLARVLRARPGEAVEVLDGRGTVTQATFLGEQGKTARLRVDSTVRHPKPSPAITLLQGIPKGKTFDTILRQAVEIGVDRIVPMVTERTEVRLSGERLSGKMEHWEAILREAAKQSGNPWFPELAQAVDFPGALTGLNLGLGIVASLEDGSQPLVRFLEDVERPEKVTLAVGPEGDFTPEEYHGLREIGFRPVRLGHQVLKCDTAALFILSVVDSCFYPRVSL